MGVERVDVVVVGTGWNGLISAKTYLDLAPDTNLVLLDEQSSIGGVWCDDKIYPSLYAQIKFGQFEYSFYPMRNEGISRDGFISGQTINRYLNDFARDYDLVRRTRLRTKVVEVERIPNGGGWRLQLEGKAPLECAKLIYASGATSHPVVPSYPQTNFTTPIIHSSEAGVHLDALLKKIKHATVVGSAKSAYDTVYMLLDAGVQVDWIIRPGGSGPLAMMPPTMMGLFHTMDAVATNMMAKMGSSIMQTEGLGYQFFNRTAVGRTLKGVFWRSVTMIAALHAGYDKSANAQKLKPLPVGNGVFWANAGLGAASAPNFWKVFHAGDCKVHKDEIASLEGPNRVQLKSGESFETDYLVLCTGFDKSYHQFSPALQQACGLVAPGPRDATRWARLDAEADAIVDELLPAIKEPPAGANQESKHHDHADADGKEKALHGPSRHYRRLVVPEFVAEGDRSIIFPGFIHTIYTPLVAEVQALWGVAFMLGMTDPPSQQAMEKEVSEWNAWSRKRYLAQGKKHAYAIYDFFPYIDMLLRDLGVSPARRGNPVAELFLPKYPKHYKGIVDEFRQAQAKKPALNKASMSL